MFVGLWFGYGDEDAWLGLTNTFNENVLFLRRRRR